MIGSCIGVAALTSFILYARAAPDDETTAINIEEEELGRFVVNEVVCSGHQLEDNFQANLAAAASKLDDVCLSELGLYTGFDSPATGTEGDTMIYVCTYGSVLACDSIRFWELNPLFDEKCPGQGAWLYNVSTAVSYGRDPAKTIECYMEK